LPLPASLPFACFLFAARSLEANAGRGSCCCCSCRLLMRARLRFHADDRDRRHSESGACAFVRACVRAFAAGSRVWSRLARSRAPPLSFPGALCCTPAHSLCPHARTHARPRAPTHCADTHTQQTQTHAQTQQVAGGTYTEAGRGAQENRRLCGQLVQDVLLRLAACWCFGLVARPVAWSRIA